MYLSAMIRFFTAFLFLTFLTSYSQPKIAVVNWQKTIGGDEDDFLTSIRQTSDHGYIAGGYTSTNRNGDKTDSSRGGQDYWVLKLNTDGQIQWQKTIGGDGVDELNVIRQTRDGGYILGGYSSSSKTGEKSEEHYGLNCPTDCFDYWIIKLNASGNIEWQNTIGGSSYDMLYSLEQTYDGGYIFAGGSGSGTSGDKTEDSLGDWDMWIVKINSTGSIQWQNTIKAVDYDLAFSIRQTSDSGYIVGGVSTSSISADKTENNRGSYDLWILKLNTSGSIIWQRTLGGVGNDQLASIRQTRDGGYIVGAISGSMKSGDKTLDSLGGFDYWILKLNAAGSIQWQRVIGGDNDEFLSVVEETADGGFVCGGTSASGVSGNKTVENKGSRDYWMVKLDTLGIIEWQSDIGGSGEDWMTDIQQTLDGNYILGGWSYSGISGDKTQNSHGIFRDYWIVKMNVVNDVNTITGSIFKGNNSDCIRDGNERGMRNIIVQTSPKKYYGITDSSGNYIIITDTGTYVIRQTIPSYSFPLYKNAPLCPVNGEHNVQFSDSTQDTSAINFANDIVLCPYLNVEYTQSRLRRCIVNNASILYCNIGNIDTTGVKVHLELPEHVFLVGADKTYSQAADGHYIFDIGDLHAGACGEIKTLDSVACVDGINGLTECLRIWITPANKCVQQLEPTYSDWDKSELVVKGRCVIPHIQYVIYNLGQSMTDSSLYRIYKDGVLAITGKFKINGGDSAIITINAVSNTIRLEADQRPFHPGNSHPSATVQNCPPNFATRAAADNLPLDDEDVDVAIRCIVIRDSYDPNSKEVSPKGVGDDQAVRHGVSLNYTINFQNTGNDTAYKIIVDDTLSPNLDLSTLELGASSHPYKMEIGGKNIPVLRFIFENVNLIDSSSNERKSHGFISFIIKPYDTIPNNSVIRNFASIYFDFNLPIRTNTAQVTITDNLPSGASLDLVTDVGNTLTFENVQVYPNPFSKSVAFRFPNTSRAKILYLYEVNGELIREINITGKDFYLLNGGDIPAGIYFYSIKNNEGNFIAHGKLIYVSVH